MIETPSWDWNRLWNYPKMLRHLGICTASSRLGHGWGRVAPPSPRPQAYRVSPLVSSHSWKQTSQSLPDWWLPAILSSVKGYCPSSTRRPVAVFPRKACPTSFSPIWDSGANGGSTVEMLLKHFWWAGLKQDGLGPRMDEAVLAPSPRLAWERGGSLP